MEDPSPTALAFLTLPEVANTPSALGNSIAVDVRVSEDELLSMLTGDRTQVGVAGLFQELCEKHGLEQQVADFVRLSCRIAGRHCFSHLKCLLHRMGHNCRWGLDAVPGAFTAQVSSHVSQLGDRSSDCALTKARSGWHGTGVCQLPRQHLCHNVGGTDRCPVGDVSRIIQGSHLHPKRRGKFWLKGWRPHRGGGAEGDERGRRDRIHIPRTEPDDGNYGVAGPFDVVVSVEVVAEGGATVVPVDTVGLLVVAAGFLSGARRALGNFAVS